MGHAHNQIAEQVGSVFLASKHHIVEASASSLEALAAMMRARLRARMQSTTDSSIIETARSLTDNLFAAYQDVYRLHPQLGAIRSEWQVPPGLYGPNDTEPERKVPDPMGLHVVSDAA